MWVQNLSYLFGNQVCTYTFWSYYLPISGLEEWVKCDLFVWLQLVTLKYWIKILPGPCVARSWAKCAQGLTVTVKFDWIEIMFDGYGRRQCMNHKASRSLGLQRPDKRTWSDVHCFTEKQYKSACGYLASTWYANIHRAEPTRLYTSNAEPCWHVVGLSGTVYNLFWHTPIDQSYAGGSLGRQSLSGVWKRSYQPW